ncbi:MAG: HEPN domain-containing protein [Pseudomonadota bacterium]
MPDRELVPGSSEGRLNRAKADLALARAPLPEGALLEDLCFHGQQAVEKAIKAVYVHGSARFRYTHDIAELLSGLIQMGVSISDDIREAATLSDYARQRYPGPAEPVTEDEYRKAIQLADSVVAWAAQQIEMSGNQG